MTLAADDPSSLQRRSVTMVGVLALVAWLAGGPMASPVYASAGPGNAAPGLSAAATTGTENYRTDGGYIVMVHATYEPSPGDLRTGRHDVDQGVGGVVIGPGSQVAPVSGDSIVFHAIAYSTASRRPVVLHDPRFEVIGIRDGQRVVLTPNVSPQQQGVCRVETAWPEHEGPIEACSAYRASVETFKTMNVVTLTLHFQDGHGPQKRVHSQPAHALLHAAILGAPIDLRLVDATMTQPSPFVIESLIDREP